MTLCSMCDNPTVDPINTPVGMVCEDCIQAGHYEEDVNDTSDHLAQEFMEMEIMNA